MFLHFIGQHWFAILFVIMWVFVTKDMVREYHTEVTPRPYKPLDSLRQRRYPKLVWSCLLAADLILIAVKFIVAPIIYFPVRKHRRREVERKSELWLQDNAAKQAQLWRKEQERITKREEWFAANPPVLYYNTVGGITAVITQNDYVENCFKTARAMRDGKWTHENVMIPIKNTYLFVNVTGEATIASLVRARRGAGTRSNDVYSGWFTDLDDLVDEHKITLRRADTIFVPYVNESLLPLDQQLYTRRSAHGVVQDLIDSQAPIELR